MLLLARTPNSEGAIVGWCPDKSGIPQAIIATPEGRVTYASIREITLMNVPRRIMKQALKVHKRDAKEAKATKAALAATAGSPN